MMHLVIEKIGPYEPGYREALDAFHARYRFQVDRVLSEDVHWFCSLIPGGVAGTAADDIFVYITPEGLAALEPVAASIPNYRGLVEEMRERAPGGYFLRLPDDESD